MKKFIVTTTINRVTTALEKYSQMDGWTLIVVGDLKTPSDFSKLECIYLSPAKQEELSKELSDAIGWNCIQRRNMGFLHALRLGADVIATVDDDNIPLPEWGNQISIGQKVRSKVFTPNSMNTFDPLAVTEYSHLWHRGYPLQHLRDRDFKLAGEIFFTPDIQAGFWNGDPDIDAICRMEHAPICQFDRKKFPFTTTGYSPFNSQNTFLSREAVKRYFMFPYIGRMDDIWASYYLISLGFRVIYTEASVFQSRNEPDLTLDFQRETEGYIHNSSLIEDLQKNPENIRKYLPKNASRAFELYLQLTSEVDKP